MEYRRTYSNDRVLYPYYRENKETAFKRVTWDHALDIVARKLREILNMYGPESILYLSYAGNMGLITRYYSERLWRYLGATFTDESMCDGGGEKAISLHYGLAYGVDVDAITRSKLLVYWGFNPATTSPHNYQLSLEQKRKGAKIVTIDVLRTQTALTSDIFLQVKPGSDFYLAAGIAKYLIVEELVDEKFIETYTYGFKDFKHHVLSFSDNVIEEKTGVRIQQVKNLARLYAETKPNIIFIGYGLQRRLGGSEAVRMISLLPALIGIHRGFYYGNADGLLYKPEYIKGYQLGKPSRIIPQSKVGEYLEKGEFKFVYIHLTNPAFTYPNAGSVIRGLKREDVFVVVHETHWSETANLANIVLPAPTWTEKDDFMRSYWHTYLGYSKKIIDPLGESREEYKVMHQLAKRLKIEASGVYEDPFKSVEKAIGSELFKKLLEENYVKLPYRKLNEYQTLTGKIEFTSKQAEREGHNPLTKPIEIEDNEYPFTLITTTTTKYTNSQFRDVYGKPQPYIYIHPKDAEKLNIQEGDPVKITTKHGAIEMLAKITNDTQEGVVYAYKQTISLDGKPINYIIYDEIGEHGGATINSTKVKINPLKQL